MSPTDPKAQIGTTGRQHIDLLTATRELRCLVVAQMSFDGLLIDANEGFFELGLVARDAGTSLDVRDAFISPRFAEFCARKPDRDHRVYEGLVTLGDRRSRNFSVRGRIEVHGAHLWVVAEHDIVEQQRLARTVLALNEQLANQQRELLRAQRAIDRERAPSPPEALGLARIASHLRIGEADQDYATAHAEATRRLARLTPRERQVLERLAAGLTHRRIAEELGISERTVATHRDNIIRKSEADSVAELIQLYLIG